MATDRLTKTQRRLLHELEEISDIAAVDYQNIRDYERETRTAMLGVMRSQMVRGFVIMRYTLIDELLGSEICRYLFGKGNFIALWKTKRFRIFNHFVLEDLFLLQKLRFVKAIRQVPRKISADIERINSLRNGLAHAFFPENLRKSPPIYKGKGIISVAGLRLFADDSQEIIDFFVSEFYGVRMPHIGPELSRSARDAGE
jgi:hypothetical protein